MGSGTKRRTLLVRPEEEQPTALECDIGRVANSRFLRVMYSVPQDLYESLVADEAADAAAAAMRCHCCTASASLDVRCSPKFGESDGNTNRRGQKSQRVPGVLCGEVG